MRVTSRGANHRLFCLLVRTSELLGGPSIVCLGGLTKPVRTAAPSSRQRQRWCLPPRSAPHPRPRGLAKVIARPGERPLAGDINATSMLLPAGCAEHRSGNGAVPKASAPHRCRGRSGRGSIVVALVLRGARRASRQVPQQPTSAPGRVGSRAAGCSPVSEASSRGPAMHVGCTSCAPTCRRNPMLDTPERGQ